MPAMKIGAVLALGTLGSSRGQALTPIEADE
jgi:hypothetical protein